MCNDLTEIQYIRRGKKTSVVPQREPTGSLLYETQSRWGGPLPTGRPTLIEEDPLRIRLEGPPPDRILHAAGIIPPGELLNKLWTLYPDRPGKAAIYHSYLYQVTLPALPAGLSLCTSDSEAPIRDIYTWEEPQLVSRSLYVNELIPGAVSSRWPHLIPQVPNHRVPYAYRLDFDSYLEVYNIVTYIYPKLGEELSDVYQARQADYARMAKAIGRRV